MTTLAQMQSRFIDHLHDEAAPPPVAGRQSGFEIYRGNYRSALIDTLRELYERTERLIGEAAFRRFAVHHALSHPPAGWSIDEIGRGFADTLSELLPENPEAADVARIEWAMHEALTASDAHTFGATDWAAAASGFSDSDWAEFRLLFVPALRLESVSCDAVALYGQLASSSSTEPHGEPGRAAIWREGEHPVAVMVDDEEGAALVLALKGEPFAAIVQAIAGEGDVEAASARAGGYIANWLREGWVAGVAV